MENRHSNEKKNSFELKQPIKKFRGKRKLWADKKNLMKKER